MQASGVGPLMFLIYINELIDVLQKLNIKVKLFADDVKLYIYITDDINVQHLLSMHCAIGLRHGSQLFQ